MSHSNVHGSYGTKCFHVLPVLWCDTRFTLVHHTELRPTYVTPSKMTLETCRTAIFRVGTSFTRCTRLHTKFIVLTNTYEDGLCRCSSDKSSIVRVCQIRNSKGPPVPSVWRGYPVLWCCTRCPSVHVSERRLTPPRMSVMKSRADCSARSPGIHVVLVYT